MDDATAESTLLDAAEALFNERGVQAVGMDALRSASGLSLKRLYRLHPSKDDLLEAVLRRRSAAVAAGLEHHIAAHHAPRDRLLAVFDFLDAWFAQPDFRGCVFINTFGEMGGVSPDVAEVARDHKAAFQARIASLVAATDVPPAAAPALSAQLAVLANGAMATAGITGTPDPARHARAAALTLLEAATAGP
ncbi:TetR/AcrR family transcriptional regulator [Streptomyces sp. NPDC058657]|uniref:TetR/AcrR family transcriptional regulator n=1 Tax=unclassified Streptomyces TaxID=2593676 RepID=UPI0036666EEC